MVDVKTLDDINRDLARIEQRVIAGPGRKSDLTVVHPARRL